MDAQQQKNVFNAGGQHALPNATAVLVLGIISIPACVCYGIVSLICAVIALVIAGKDMRAFRANPSLYTRASYNNLNAGRICAIIGMILGVLFMIFLAWYINKIGIECATDPECVQKTFDSWRR